VSFSVWLKTAAVWIGALAPT